MPEKPGVGDPRTPTPEPEKSEYAFEEGVQEALRRIQKLYSTENRSIAVGINGSSINVGKTTLAQRLARDLKEAGIPAAIIHDASWEDLMIEEDGFRAEKAGHQKQFGVYIIDAKQGLAGISMKEYRAGLRAGRGSFPCDLYIAIYRPDKPFDQGEPLGDMTIRNESAKDK